MTVFLLSLILFAGCFGGSQSASQLTDDSPHAAVNEILRNWREAEGPVFSVAPSGAIACADTAPENDGYIRFRDLSGKYWNLLLGQVNYLTDNKADVDAYYYSISAEYGGLKIVFHMIKDQGKWFLDDIDVVALPAVIVSGTGVKGIISDQITALPVSGARVEIYLAATGALAGATVTAENGFYSITGLAAGNYYLVVARDGYESYTINGIVVY